MYRLLLQLFYGSFAPVFMHKERQKVIVLFFFGWTNPLRVNRASCLLNFSPSILCHLLPSLCFFVAAANHPTGNGLFLHSSLCASGWCSWHILWRFEPARCVYHTLTVKNIPSYVKRWGRPGNESGTCFLSPRSLLLGLKPLQRQIKACLQARVRHWYVPHL